MASALDFSITKGQTYNITVEPEDAANDLAEFANNAAPTATIVDPTIFQLGTIVANPDGTYTVPVTGLAKGASAIKIDGMGASPIEVEADGAVTLPLATQIVLTGALAS